MAEIDKSQDFSEMWVLDNDEVEPIINEIEYPDNSLESLFWPLYRQLYVAIRQHTNTKDLQWHCRTLELLREQVTDLIIKIEEGR